MKVIFEASVCVLFVVATLACDGSSGTSGTSATPPPAPTPPPRAQASAPTEVEMVATMEAHYGVVILAHDALLQGDLDLFRRQLSLVPELALPSSAPNTWQPHHDRLRRAASGADAAVDLDTAAHTLADVVLSCGLCHEALETGPVYPAPAPDDGGTPVETAMLDHQWATERMWEGVTGPWENAWQRGADALAETRVFGDLGPGVSLAPELARREEALRAIGREARLTPSLRERARLYGQLLATCGECHREAGIRLGPPPGP